MKKVSVIIPTHNRYEVLQESIESVIAQKYRPLELVVVDDGSEGPINGIFQKASESASESGVVLKWISQENQGVSSARNRGFSESCGEYILFHDSDDILGEDRIELQVNKLEASNCELCAAGIVRFKKDGEIIIKYSPVAKNCDLLSSREIAQMHLGTQIFMYKRPAIENVKWNVKLSCAEDVDFNFRVLCQNGMSVCLEPLAFTKIRESDDKFRLSYIAEGMDSHITVRSGILDYYRNNEMYDNIPIAQAILLRTVTQLWNSGSKKKARGLFHKIRPFHEDVVSGGVGERITLASRSCMMFCFVRRINEWYGSLKKS